MSDRATDHLSPASDGTPDLALVGATTLVAAGPEHTEFRVCTVEVTDGRISAITPTTDEVSTVTATEVIDARGLVLLPGFVNTHCHAAMTLLRGAAEDVTVRAWFDDFIWPMEVNLQPDDVYLGTMAAAAEMISCGVTTVADHYFFMEQAARAVIDSGMRADLGSAFFSSQGDDGFERSVGFARDWHGAGDGRITTSIAPHAPYTCTDADLERAADAARDLGVRVHIHAAEDMHQTEVSLRDRSLTPVQVLERTGVLDAGAIIAHGNGIVPIDLPVLARYADRVGVTHGPKGYLRFALGPLTPIRGLLAAGVPVGYCTDGAASNSTLDIAENMRVAAMSQKQAEGDSTWFTSSLALHLAGPGSAATIGRSKDIGSVRVGAAADLILVDVSGIHCQPLHDLAAALVYSLQPGDVRTTIVAGRVLMRDRRLLTIDLPALLDEFRSRAVALTDRSHGRRIQDYTT